MTEYKKVFLDTTPLIYFLDSNEIYGEKVRDILETLLNNNVRIITSTITVAEYLVYPYRTDNMEKINAFEDFLRECDVIMCPVNYQTAKKAAQIRAMYGHFKAMDSLQLAAACVHDCRLFITNDKQLRQFKELKCITLDEWGNGEGG